MTILNIKRAILGVVPAPQVELIRKKIGAGMDLSKPSGHKVELQGGTSVLAQPAVGGDLDGHIALELSNPPSGESKFYPSLIVVADSGLLHAVFVRERDSAQGAVQMDYKMAQDRRYLGVLDHALSLVGQVSDAIRKAA